MEPFDIISGPPIHGNIPNKWFLDNGLENEFVYSDVLTRDPDNDGFTVQEEYAAKTHPNDPNSHPPLVSKLFVDEIKQFGFYLAFTQADGNDFTFKGMNRAKQEKWQEMPLSKHMKIYEDKGLSRKEAMKAVAKDRGVSKREIYAKLLEDE